MNTEPEYDNMQMVRMAIVEKDDRLIILLPPTATPDQVQGFLDNYESMGWPTERVMVLSGPEAFAVIKPRSTDEPEGH